MYAIFRNTTNEYFSGQFREVDIGYAIVNKTNWCLGEVEYIATWKNKLYALEYIELMKLYKWIDFPIKELEVVEV